jgi:hypothetical protein
MGKLQYGTSSYELDDRLLAHLQMVVSAKLRRGEKFMLSWYSRPEEGGHRQALWIDNGLHLSFTYAGASIPKISREWVEGMAQAAATAAGLQLTDEHGELLHVPHEEQDVTPSARA